jgi:hypothetical protein
MVLRIAALRPLALLLCLAAALAFADPAPFDLAGPRIEVKVRRGEQTLPITAVPNLAPGDKLWIQPDFPPDQAAHYLLIVAFLRGATNQPPESWFFKAETWNKKFTEGMYVTVPEGARQALLFLAPETGGDFKTLVNAVTGRPGAFVRASQDLYQASLDRTRLDAYLDAVRRVNATDPAKLKEVSPLLARSLGIKLDKDCLDKYIDEQASCLVQKQDALILNDGHSMSIVGTLTSGTASDLSMQASYTPRANFGYYSPYIASIIDIARILDSIHTAEYQYIPALASQHESALDLKLNTAPSFHNPKSVIVVALPPVEAAQPPPLHPVDDKQVFCAAKSSLVLPADGAPLVFSTGYARDLVLRLQDGNKKVDLPLKADAAKGGLVVDNKALAQVGADANSTLHGPIQGVLHGYWGFTSFEGTAFHLQGPREQNWQISSADRDALVVGRDDTFHLQADNATCVESIKLRDSSGKDEKADWKLVAPDRIEVTLPLKEAQPGSMTLVVEQAGLEKPQEVQLHTFASAGHLESFTLHAGDHQGVLKGSRLDEVAGITLNGVKFEPGQLSRADGDDELVLNTKDQAADNLAAGQQTHASVTLHDGRSFDVPATVKASRPRVTLLSKNIDTNATGPQGVIQLASQDELPQNSTLTFSLKAQSPLAFSHADQIEVATEDGSYTTLLNMADGTVVLQDTKTALATLVPSKAFGGSAFGQLRFRIVDTDGAKGDWQPLATLIRLPTLQDLKCPSSPDQPCSLTGSALYLLDSVSSDAEFSHPIQVPDGFPGNALSVPHPEAEGLYVKLRDDPAVVNLVTLTPEPIQKSQSASARSTRRSANAMTASSAQPRPASSQQHSASTAPTPAAQPALGSSSTPQQPPATTSAP